VIRLILNITAAILGITASVLCLLLLVALVYGFLGYLRDRKKAK
jgi:hypothetical protein